MKELPMNIFTRGFQGRRRDSSGQLPPGQYLTSDFPVLSAGPTPRISLDAWEFTVTTEQGESHRWSWAELMALPAESVTVDVHCVTRWSKLDTVWRGVSLDTLLADVETEADFALVHSYGGYSTNLPLEDLLDGHGLPMSTRARNLHPSTVDLLGCWSPICTFGSRPSGCAALT
jgi:DMSO/TMAO reductase YedYZ molybdopterin-dependent catalytic subunit